MNLMNKLILGLLILLSISLFAPVPVSAKDLYSDEIVLGGTYTLREGQTLDGNLLVLGGTATLETGSRVIGDVVLLGGSLEVDGDVNGDILATGGSVELKEHAMVRGDINLLGSNFERAPGAVVTGGVNTGIRGPFLFTLPGGIQAPQIRFNFSPLWELVRFFFTSFALSALAVLWVMFWPSHTQRVAEAVVSQPLISGGLGLITIIIAPFILLAMGITIILLPASFLGLILLGIIFLFGWVAIGLEIGQRLAAMTNSSWAPALAAGLGTLLLSLVVNSFGFIACIGWIPRFVVAIVGLGGVLLTRFGTRGYPDFQVSPGSPGARIYPKQEPAGNELPPTSPSGGEPPISPPQ